MKQGLALLITCCVFISGVYADTSKEGFLPLFNGKDLSGWVNVNGAPSTWTVKDGMIHCSGKPTGALRTVKQYENFILDYEWRHLKAGGNSGTFVWASPVMAPGVPFLRGIEVQILDHGYGKANWFTTHGDVFPIHGATMTPFPPSNGSRSFPSEERSKGSPEWNHYRVTCKDGTLWLAVNGKDVSGGKDCVYRKGYIALESEGAPVDFRNIRIKELPGSNPKPEEIAPMDQGFVTLYNGVNLEGWKEEPGKEGHWKPRGWRLGYDGHGGHLWTEASFSDFELICDWRWPKKNQEGGDSGIFLRGHKRSQVNIWASSAGSGGVYGFEEDEKLSNEWSVAAMPKTNADKPAGKWNRFIITVKGDLVTVRLNDRVVVENTRLPGIPKSGPIGLQHQGAPIEFGNLFVRDLK